MGSDLRLREIFHFLFLDTLLKISDPSLYILKGGVNLRFFFKSPRYSEDMDLDIRAGAVHTLKKNGFKILQDAAFRRVLSSYGIVDLRVNDPKTAKQTETTQRFRVQLVNQASEIFPTKIEFSRRNQIMPMETIKEMVDVDIARQYRRLTFGCEHYTASAAALQKLKALALRTHPQVRDPFDLFILMQGTTIDPDLSKKLSATEREQAYHHLIKFSYADYEGQVLEYLSLEDQKQYQGQKQWNMIRSSVEKFVHA